MKWWGPKGFVDYGMSSEFSLELLVTDFFEQVDQKTKITMKHAGTKALKSLQAYFESTISSGVLIN